MEISDSFLVSSYLLRPLQPVVCRDEPTSGPLGQRHLAGRGRSSTSGHVSCVTCHKSHVTIIIFVFGQSGEAYRWRVCYQRGLPRLVLLGQTLIPCWGVPLFIWREIFGHPVLFYTVFFKVTHFPEIPGPCKCFFKINLLQQ